MKKDKIYELRVDEEDEISGIDSISLVSEPAIEINWVAFNKVKPQEFFIPDGEDMKFSSMITSKGHSEEDLFNDGWKVMKQEFITSSPNSPSFEDTDEKLIRYKYVKNPQAPGAAVKETTREFCRDLLNKNFVYRVEDLDNITNDLGSSALVWRGSYNCRHKWMRIEYRRDATIVNKGSVTKGRIDDEESYDVIGYPQPDTRTSNPSFSKEDFKEGVAHYTEDGKLYEGPTHKDASGRLMTGAVHTEDSEYLYHEDELEYDVSTIGGYVDEGIRKRKKKKKSFQEVIECMKCDHSWDMEDGGVDIYICHKCGYDNTPKKKDFASYSDYPESVKNNAKSVLKYVDENGWGSCGTPVGKQRANDLAQGNPISEETIKRMYSYLSRHKLDLESSKSYDDGCGKLMYDSWGGLSALSWSESKINSIEREKMSKQNFKTDDEKRIVIGPAMVPNLNIFRRDKEGNPYYVTFTSDTIKMIMEKYMRNKYIDNNDTEHNGKVAQDVYVIESWIKEDEEDKSNKYGFQDLPIGTWFVSMKVKNDEIWDMVKKKELNGFSVSGFFEEVEQFYKEQEFLKQLSEILKKI